MQERKAEVEHLNREKATKIIARLEDAISAFPEPDVWESRRNQ
jgi:hypothetical protein